MKNRHFVNMGTALLLVVFFSLALSIFAVLALSGAKNDLTLSDELAARRKEYYSAVSECEETLSRIDDIAAEVYSTAEGEEEYFAALAAALEGAGLDGYDSVTGSLCFLSEINESQRIETTLTFSFPEPGECFYAVTSYKSISADTWEADSTLNLISFDD